MCIQLLTRFDLKSLPSVATVTLPNSIRGHISRTNLSQKQKYFYQLLIESERKENAEINRKMERQKNG